MTYQIREGGGSLFPNDRKEKPEQPDYTGNLRVGGVLYRLAGWSKKSSGGKWRLSLSAKPDAGRTDSPEAPRSSPTASEDLNDDIPF